MDYPSDVLDVIFSYTPLYDIFCNIFKSGKKRTVIFIADDTIGDIFKFTLQCMRIIYKEISTTTDEEGDLLLVSRRGMEGISIRGAKRLVTVCQRPKSPQVLGRAIRPNKVVDIERHVVYTTDVYYKQ